jgi:hypothetical protein
MGKATASLYQRSREKYGYIGFSLANVAQNA